MTTLVALCYATSVVMAVMNIASEERPGNRMLRSHLAWDYRRLPTMPCGGRQEKVYSESRALCALSGLCASKRASLTT